MGPTLFLILYINNNLCTSGMPKRSIMRMKLLVYGHSGGVVAGRSGTHVGGGGGAGGSTAGTGSSTAGSTLSQRDGTNPAKFLLLLSTSGSTSDSTSNGMPSMSSSTKQKI